MEFTAYTVQLKKGTSVHLHTPSCRHNLLLKKKGHPLRKIAAPYVEDAAQQLSDANPLHPVVVHAQCVKLFRKPHSTNPACVHCQHPDTVLRGKLSPGHYEYACKSCQKTFVVKKERVMKIKISKSSKAAAKKLTRDQRKAARLQARADRKAAREKKREERQGARIVRMGTRMQKMAQKFTRMAQIDQAAVADLMKAIEECTGALPITAATKTPKAKTTKAPRAKKTAKAAPLKTVAYAPVTNQPAPKAAAKKTSRKK